MIDQSLKEWMVEGLRRHVTQNDSRPVNQQLRPHQIDALNDVIDHLQKDIEPLPSGEAANVRGAKQFDGGSIEMATGLGKTYAELASVIGLAQSIGEPAVIVTPRIRLNTQFAETYTHPEKMGLHEGDIAIYDSARDNVERARALNGARIIVTTDDGFRFLTERGIISPEPRRSDGTPNPAYRPLVIADEGDMFIGHETANVLRRYRDNSVVLTWTATNYGVDREIFNGQPTIHTHSLRDAIPKGLLTRGVKTAVIEANPDDNDIRRYVEEHRQDYSRELLEWFAENKAIGNQVARWHAQYEDQEIGPIRRLPTLVTVPTIKAAGIIADCFNRIFGEDYAIAVSGQTPQEDVVNPSTGAVVQEGLNTILRRFNSGEGHKVIVFPEVIGRGIDIPNATVLYSLRPYLTPNNPEQHLGRITRRGDPDYAQRFGCDKVSLAINVKTPQMNPILFSQIIGGPTIYEPGERHPYRGGGGVTPPIPRNMPEPGNITVHTETSDLNRLYEDAQRARDERLATVPDGWITLQEAVERAGLSEQRIREVIKHIYPQRQYTTLGYPPARTEHDVTHRGRDPQGTPTVSGNELKRNHRGKVLLREEMVDRWVEKMRQSQQHRDAGNPTTEDTSKDTGIDKKTLRREIDKTIRPGGTDENLGDAKDVPPDVKDGLDKKREEDKDKDQGKE